MVEGGHMVIARDRWCGRCARPGTTRRHHRHAAEPVRPAGVGVPGDVADRCRYDRGQADRSGDQPALSELCGAAPEARVLAESHHARVLRSVGSRSARGSARAGRIKERVRTTVDPRGRSLPADAQRHATVRAVADDSAAAGDVAGAATRRCSIRRRRSGTIAATATATTSSWSRG